MTSGSSGHFTAKEGVWQFSTDWATRIDSTQTSQIKVGMDVSELRWWDLAATDSLVTAGGHEVHLRHPVRQHLQHRQRLRDRGDHPDGTLRVMYLPNAA